MLKRMFVFALAMVMCIPMIVTTYGAQRGPTRVSLPNFNVTINGQVLNNSYSQYPLIVYNNVTYFPMTFNDCRYLGIESTWKGDKEGLIVEATNVTAAFNPYISSKKNLKTYMASVVNFPIKVNGKVVDNSTEEYPLLSFRNITYFPMSWKYSVEEFGWDYKFDEKNGLVITSKNIKLDQTAISKDRPLEDEWSLYKGKKSTAVLVKNGYVYYSDNKGSIIQAPLTDTGKSKKILELGTNSYSSGYNNYNFYEENGKAMLYVHVGGAVMGYDCRFELNADGTTRQIQKSYYQTTAYGNQLFSYFVGPTPGPGNLRIENFGDNQAKALGEAKYWYYGLTNVSGLSKLTLIDKQLYVLAAPVLNDSPEEYPVKLGTRGVYKVNIDTNQVVKVSKNEKDITTAQIEGDCIYYLSDQNVYKVSLQDGTETLIGKTEGLMNEEGALAVSFAVLGGKIYYMKEDKNLYVMGNSTSVNPKANFLRMNITGDKEKYLACEFEESAASKYRMMIFNKNGDVVFKTSDCGTNVVIEGNTMYFYNVTTEKVCSAKLK